MTKNNVLSTVSTPEKSVSVFTVQNMVVIRLTEYPQFEKTPKINEKVNKIAARATRC